MSRGAVINYFSHQATKHLRLLSVLADGDKVREAFERRLRLMFEPLVGRTTRLALKNLEIKEDAQAEQDLQAEVWAEFRRLQQFDALAQQRRLPLKQCRLR